MGIKKCNSCLKEKPILNVTMFYGKPRYTCEECNVNYQIRLNKLGRKIRKPYIIPSHLKN